MAIIAVVTQILSALVLLGCIFIILFLVLYRLLKNRFSSITSFFEKNALLFAFLVALLATSASLFYSEVAGYEPCKLCWFQRIFMYPQVILLGIALIKKDKIGGYIIPLNIIGGCISLYHYYIQRMSSAGVCAVDGISCNAQYFYYYGFITMPMMALVAFVLILLFIMMRKSN